MKALCQPSKGTSVCSQCNTVIPENVVRSCSSFKTPPTGLGTKVASLISKLGYKEKCIPCQKRAAKLDKFSNWLYLYTVGWWNGLKPKRRKTIRKKHLVTLSSQENPDLQARKEAKRQAMLEQQKLS